MIDVISYEGIKSFLSRELKDKLNINTEKTVTSTNTIVKEIGRKGESEGYVLISESQAQGRGRLGRSFFSPDGTGVYMSILLKPSIQPEDITLITTAAAVSVCLALERLGVSEPLIKWVNDVFVDGKKVCGILTDGSFSSAEAVDFAVLGVGINIYEPLNDFPEELKTIAGGVFTEKEAGLRNRFIAYFLESFFEFYGDLVSRKHISEYKKRCFIIGKEVCFTSDGKEYNATAVGVDENCGLHVIFDTGESLTLSTGEVSVSLNKLK